MTVDYSHMSLESDNAFLVWTDAACCHGRGCEACGGTGDDVDWVDLSTLLHNLAVAGALTTAAYNAEQRCRALESELATLRASVVAALSSAGPEGGEDERTA